MVTIKKTTTVHTVVVTKEGNKTTTVETTVSDETGDPTVAAAMEKTEAAMEKTFSEMDKMFEGPFRQVMDSIKNFVRKP